MQTTKITHLQDVRGAICALDPTASQWGNGSECDWVFRGNGDESFELLPTAWRTPLPAQLQNIIRRDQRYIDDAFSKHPASEDRNVTRERQVFENSYAEATAAWEFIHFSDELGLEPPLLNERSMHYALSEAGQAINFDSGVGMSIDYLISSHPQLTKLLA